MDDFSAFIEDTVHRCALTSDTAASLARLDRCNNLNMVSALFSALQRQHVMPYQALLQAGEFHSPSSGIPLRSSTSVSRTTHPSSVTQPSTAPTSLLTSSTLGALALQQPLGPSGRVRSSSHPTPPDLFSESSVSTGHVSEGSLSGTSSTNMVVSCPLCRSTFTGSANNGKRNLRRHLKCRHTNEARLVCPEPDCSTTFRPCRLDNLNRHLQQQHKVHLESSAPERRKRKADEMSDVCADGDLVYPQSL